MTRKLSTPFAINSTLINQVPISQTSDSEASYDIGFPPKNFQTIANGGVAVDGKDFNGILNDITGNIVDLNKGLPQYYDDAYSTLIGGYPIGSRLVLNDNSTTVISTIANNTNNPNNNMTGWVKFAELETKDKISSIESIADLASLNAWDGRVVYVKSYVKGLKKGGGYRIYNVSRSSENDNVVCINGWVLIHNGSINLYQGGVVGDGITDDVNAFQNVVNSANKIQAKIVGNPSDIYLFKTITNQGGDFNNFITCKTSYLNIDLNGSTIKIADNAGDYTSIFHVNWTHTYARITNGTINCNTANNLPQGSVSWDNTKNQRITINAALVNHKYFEASNLVLQDCSGAWEMLVTLSDVINITNNTLQYSSSSTLNYTDRTSIFIFPKLKGTLAYNIMSGGTYGNAVTAFEIHNSNVMFHHNTVSGYRTSLYIAPNDSDVYSGQHDAIYENIYVFNNKFLSVQSGVVFWIEDGSKLDRNMQNIHVYNNYIYIDSYLLTSSHQVSPGLGIGELGGNYKSNANGIYIKDNIINYAWHSEDVGGSDVYTGINFVTRLTYASIFTYSNWFIENNTVNGSPYNSVCFGCVKGGASFTDFHIVNNSLTYCGWAKVASDRASIKLANIKGSFFIISGNTSSDNGNTDNYMSMFSFDTQMNMSKISNNPFLFTRSANANEMYQVGGNLIDEQICVALTASGTTIQAKKGSRLTLPSGDILVQTANDYTNPVWQQVTYSS